MINILCPVPWQQIHTTDTKIEQLLPKLHKTGSYYAKLYMPTEADESVESYLVLYKYEGQLSLHVLLFQFTKGFGIS